MTLHLSWLAPLIRSFMGSWGSVDKWSTLIHKAQVYTRMSSVAGYSAMAVYILSDAELHISKKLTALKKGINISKVQFLARLDEVQEELLYNPRRGRWRRR